MSRRTNSIDAAAISIGVDADLLEWILPMLQEMTRLIRDGKANPQDAYLSFFTKEYIVTDHKTSDYIQLKPMKQCGTPGAGPCTCGE